MASGDHDTTASEDYSTSSVSIGMVGIEPTFLRPKRSVIPFYYIPLMAGGISMCGQNHLSHFQAGFQPGRGVALPAI
jgi:hypothetical protein